MAVAPGTAEQNGRARQRDPTALQGIPAVDARAVIEDVRCIGVKTRNNRLGNTFVRTCWLTCAAFNHAVWWM